VGITPAQTEVQALRASDRTSGRINELPHIPPSLSHSHRTRTWRIGPIAGGSPILATSSSCSRRCQSRLSAFFNSAHESQRNSTDAPVPGSARIGDGWASGSLLDHSSSRACARRCRVRDRRDTHGPYGDQSEQFNAAVRHSIYGPALTLTATLAWMTGRAA
jgi:hypothetical protein